MEQGNGLHNKRVVILGGPPESVWRSQQAASQGAELVIASGVGADTRKCGFSWSGQDEPLAEHDCSRTGTPA